MKKFNPDEPLRCSFCHKTQEQVEKLISSPSDYPRAYICNECVSVCQTILEDEKREQATAPARRLPRPDINHRIPHDETLGTLNL